MAKATKKQLDYIVNYTIENVKKITINFNQTKEEDVILYNWIMSKSNKTKLVKELLKEQMLKE